MNTPDSILEALRICQKNSLKTIEHYLESDTQKGSKEQSCLISLPTGAGKSGVICCASHFNNLTKTLILTHRRAVCNQLFKDIRGDFFKKILNCDDVSEYINKSVVNDIDSEHKGILCSTFQKLTTLLDDEIETLASEVDLIIIDEGHAEPSPTWGRTVRKFSNSKKIIITATPYRNDLFTFDIHTSHHYIYTYKNATDDKVIISPAFETIQPTEIIDKISDIQAEQPDSVFIIKCKTFSQIQEYFRKLSSAFNTIAIHENFEGELNTSKTFKTVPANLKNREYQVIIHQRKLDEGVDLPQAKTLFLTYPVGSGRELVQTVGRIIRTHNDYSAKVFEFDGEKNKALWRNYLDFDAYLSDEGSAENFIKTLDTAKLIKTYIDEFPEYSYFEKGYKQKFQFDEFNPIQSLKIPLASVCFYHKQQGFALASCVDTLYWEYSRQGALTKICTEEVREENTKVMVSILFHNSKYLYDSLFFEPSLEIMVLKELSNNILAVFDSKGRRFANNDDLKIGRVVDTEQLFKIIAQTSKTKTKQATAQATQTSEQRAERVTWQSNDLEKVNQPATNANQALTTVIASNIDENDKVESSYYLGVHSGRISDQKKYNFSYREFISWLDDIDEKLKSDSAPKSSFINSFAQIVEYAPKDDPELCILDFNEAIYEIKYKGFQFTLESTFISKTYKNGFDILGMKQHKIIELQPSYSAYKSFTPFIPFQEDLLVKISFDEEMQLCFEANENLCFTKDGQIVNADEFFKEIKLIYNKGVSYLNNQFYQTQLPTDKKSINTKLLSKIIPLHTLKRKGLSEKDDKILIPNEFGKDSIFHEIDKLSSKANSDVALKDLGDYYSYIPDIDLVLCTDMGTEPADFILSSPNKLVFVHVKCGTAAKDPRSSAGAIAEVGSQAIKNMHYLLSQSVKLKYGNNTELRSDWEGVVNRIRMFNGLSSHTLDDVLDKIETRKQSAVVQKEIWLVIGNAFSKSHFTRSLNSISTANSETIQAYHLLDTWLARTSSYDVNFKMFVSD